jgi:hypothetical protein
MDCRRRAQRAETHRPLTPPALPGAAFSRFSHSNGAGSARAALQASPCGQLDLEALSALSLASSRTTVCGTTGLAGQHRPVDRDAARVAALELRARGLTVEDIGQALGLSSGAVRELLEASP